MYKGHTHQRNAAAADLAGVQHGGDRRGVHGDLPHALHGTRDALGVPPDDRLFPCNLLPLARHAPESLLKVPPTRRAFEDQEFHVDLFFPKEAKKLPDPGRKHGTSDVAHIPDAGKQEEVRSPGHGAVLTEAQEEQAEACGRHQDGTTLLQVLVVPGPNVGDGVHPLRGVQLLLDPITEVEFAVLQHLLYLWPQGIDPSLHLKLCHACAGHQLRSFRHSLRDCLANVVVAGNLPSGLDRVKGQV
mmetsp:Transcript_40277/g.82298  ORF Transcript_40277/g.82298 Transcript_40277/m.82298 type:complete len:244 (-) Transcript_40277:34-765(-)